MPPGDRTVPSDSPTAVTALTNEQIQFFKNNGFLILHGLIEPAVVEVWQEAIWSHLGTDPNDQSTWKRDYVVEGLQLPDGTNLNQQARVKRIVEQLGDGAFAGGGGAPLIKWPEPEKAEEWSLPDDGHVDGYGPGGWSPFMLGATAYVFDVEHQGGGFTYWPKSHFSAWRYLLDNPETVDGSFRDREGFTWLWFLDDEAEGPCEFAGKAGDVVLWHSYLFHTGSMNVRERPRIAFFGRWSHRDREGFKYEIPEDLWKRWAI